MDTKTCKCCRVTKPLSDFYTRADSADGYMRQCKKCKGASSAASHRARKALPASDEMESDWPLAAPPPLDVQLAHLHMKRAYGATPGQLRGAL